MYPAIGMADVQFPTGTTRYPVEDLQRLEVTPKGAVLPAPAGEEHASVPGGAQTVITESKGKPGEAAPQEKAAAEQQVRRVAEAFVKKALYWASKDRHYKATTSECESGQYKCPKCKDAVLRKATYQRAEGKSEHLLGCPNCLFLIKKCDIIGDPDYMDDVAASKEPFASLKRSGHLLMGGGKQWRS